MACERRGWSAYSSVLLAAALGSSTAAGATLYVGGGGAPSYADLQSAVNAAQPGDTIVVASGSYAGFTLDEPLVIVAPDGAVVNGSGLFGWDAPLRAQLDAPGILRLVGLQFTTPREGCRIAGNTGSIIDIEECTFDVRFDASIPLHLLEGGLHVVGVSSLRARSTNVVGRSGLSVRGEPRCDVALTDCALQNLQGACSRFGNSGTFCSDAEPALSAHSCADSERSAQLAIACDLGLIGARVACGSSGSAVPRVATGRSSLCRSI
jgi:hypothetical protein